jgi:hypothetical protein
MCQHIPVAVDYILFSLLRPGFSLLLNGSNGYFRLAKDRGMFYACDEYITKPGAEEDSFH